MQHPPYVKTLCEYKLCKTPCGNPIQDADVGHGTHSDSFPNVKYISSIDSSGNANRPEFLYENVTKNLDLQPILEKPGSYFTAYCRYPNIIIISFIYFPLLTVSSIFLICNIYCSNLMLFFKSLILLIPMLLMQLWLFILLSYSKRRLDHLSQFLQINYIGETKQYRISLKPDHLLPIFDDFPISSIKAKFEVLCDFWQIYSTMYSFMKDIESIRNKYDPFVQSYTSLCFFFGWVIQLVLRLL